MVALETSSDRTGPMACRLASLRKAMASADLDAIIISHPADRYYLSGLRARDSQPGETAGWLVISENTAHGLFSSAHYDEVKSGAKHLEIERIPAPSAGRIALHAASILRREGWRRIGYQAEALSARWYSQVGGGLGPEQSLVPAGDLMPMLRSVKDAAEIRVMRLAADITTRSFEEVMDKLTPGVTEREVAWELEKSMREIGADGPGFAIIVAAGEGAAVPHHTTGDRKIGVGEPVIIDMGAEVQGYCSDMTRTVCLGPASSRLKETYRAVKTSLDEAIARATPGNRGRYLCESGSDTVGHGIGLVVHEFPYLKEDDPVLSSGMTLAIEPGIYVPGWGGVRLEDTVLVTEEGPERLTRASFDLEIGI